MTPTLAVIAGLLSFWIAQTAGSWPMAVAGLAAYVLALLHIRLPQRRQDEQAEVTVTVLPELEHISHGTIKQKAIGEPVGQLSR